MSFPALRLPLFSSAVSVLLGVGTMASAQTVTTDPVGFITLTVAGTGQGGATALSFKGLGLARPVEFQGVATGSTTNTITSSNAAWTAGQFSPGNGPYYVEIIGASTAVGVGTMYDITGNTTTQLTVAQDFATGLAGTLPTFRIRKHWTIASVFGATNQAGLQGGTSTTADTILVYSSAAASYDTYYYSTKGLAGTGWRKAGGGGADQAATILYPDDGLLIRRSQSGNVNLVLMGAVKTGQTSFPVVPGLNILANPFAAPMTLGSCGLYKADGSALAAGTAATADQVQIYNGTSYDTYYYSNGAAGAGWRLDDGNGSTVDQTAVQIPGWLLLSSAAPQWRRLQLGRAAASRDPVILNIHKSPHIVLKISRLFVFAFLLASGFHSFAADVTAEAAVSSGLSYKADPALANSNPTIAGNPASKTAVTTGDDLLTPGIPSCWALFNLTDAQIQASATNLPFLQSQFIAFTSLALHIGDGFPGINGVFSRKID